MSKKMICLLSLALALGLISISYGDVVYDFETGAQGWGGLKDGTAPTVSPLTHSAGGTQSLRVTIDEAANGQQEGGWASPRDFTVDQANVAAGGFTTLSFWYRIDDPNFNGGNFVCHWISSTENWSGGGWYGNGLWGVVIADGQWHEQTFDLSILGQAAGGWEGTWGDQTAWEFRDDLRYSIEIAVAPTDNTAGSNIYIDDVRLVGPSAPPSASVVIGDFEDGLGSWKLTWEAADKPALAITTSEIGATLGTKSLALTPHNGWAWAVMHEGVVDLSQYPKLSADVTWVASEWAGSGMWVNFKDMAINSDGPSGWKQYIPADAVNPNYPGSWDPINWGNHTRTLTWDVSGYDATGATWMQIIFSVNMGGVTTPGNFYIDNVQLAGPLPPDTGKSTDTVIGNWEQSMDGWVVGGGADVRFAVPGTDVKTANYEPNGVTLGNNSLDIYVATGAWNENVLVLNLFDPNNAAALAAFRANTKVSADVTRKVADWPVDDVPPWNEIMMTINAGGDGWSLWQNIGKLVSWQQIQGNRTMTATWDYAPYLSRINSGNITRCELRLGINANSPDYAGWVWFYIDNMKLSGAGIPLNPQPASGALDVPVDSKLSWTPGTFAAKHHVYLGTNSAKVRDADKNSDPDVIFAEVDAATFDPNGLAFKTQYFWRVDEVNAANPDSPWEGSVWSFTTADFLIVDNFESYNDINPGEPGSNRILEAWTDGFGTTTNGALVGYNSPPYADQTTVHGGLQAMPLSYNNTGAAVTSETQHVWPVPQNWTWAISGLNVLKFYTHGNPQNKAGQLYFIIEDNAGVSYKVTNPDATVLTADAWAEWTISLNDAAVAGVNLTAVKKLVIGIADLAGQPEASGLVQIDDIRRYPPIVIPLDPDHLVVPKTAVTPVIDGQWDTVWNDVNETKCLITNMTNTDSAAPENANDLSARFKAMFDDNNFYVFVEVLDSVIDTTFSDWQGDGLEIYFDGDYSHGTTYDGVNDNQIRITVADVTLADTNSSLAIDGTVFKVLRTAVGYNIEASFPLAALQIHPAVDPPPARDATGAIIPGTGVAASNIIGFEVQINDNDGAGGRQTLLRWHSDDNNSYQNPSLFGQARLMGK